MEVSKESISQTTHCEKNFVCLHKAKHVYCKVESFVNDAAIFILCKDNKYCSYQDLFGVSFICKCPIRNEIFYKQGI